MAIRNIPDKLHKLLKERAARHRRSVNDEAISCLGSVLMGSRVDPRMFLAEVDALHKRMPRVHLTEKFLRAAKNEGRS